MKLAFSISWDRKKVGITYIWIFLGINFLLHLCFASKIIIICALCVCVCVCVCVFFKLCIYIFFKLCTVIVIVGTLLLFKYYRGPRLWSQITQ